MGKPSLFTQSSEIAELPHRIFASNPFTFLPLTGSSKNVKLTPECSEGTCVKMRGFSTRSTTGIGIVRVFFFLLLFFSLLCAICAFVGVALGVIDEVEDEGDTDGFKIGTVAAAAADADADAVAVAVVVAVAVDVDADADADADVSDNNDPSGTVDELPDVASFGDIDRINVHLSSCVLLEFLASFSLLSLLVETALFVLFISFCCSFGDKEDESTGISANVLLICCCFSSDISTSIGNKISRISQGSRFRGFKDSIRRAGILTSYNSANSGTVKSCKGSCFHPAGER
ncbi:MAG: hypothetical protein EXX96DRAFT_586580 [Benjaminiella poitrasii]|nr:MAG: hypothetical protein EXX96DRAFT_586580 [Benjaminiella poitrasii]